MVEFEWDENKRLSNIEKHGIDCLRAEFMLDGRPGNRRDNDDHGEVRIATED